MRILLIRPGAIGDTLLTLPIIDALRATYDAPHIMFVGNAAVLPLARSIGLVDDAFDYEDPFWGKLFLADAGGKTALRARLQFVHMAICWLRDPDGVVAKNLSAAGIERVIIAPGRPADGEAVHIVQYLARTAELFWLPQWLKWQLPGRWWERQPHTTTVAIHAGSGGAAKCWPIASFAAVITALWQRDVPVLLLTGPADHERLIELINLLGSVPHPGLLTLLIDTPLLEVAASLAQCRCYLGNDSGISHLAAMVGAPTIVLFGPSDPAIWHPIGPSVIVKQSVPLENLSANVILSTIDRFIL